MDSNQILLETKLGKLRGQTRQSTFSKTTFYSFQGIPYGKPPVGDLRFKAPQPYGSWDGIRDALEDGQPTKQPVLFPKPGMDPNQTEEGDEDCLNLNVYIRELPHINKTKKPVLFSIHGGGFFGGSAAMSVLGPGYLMEEDVVVVSVNYRCGAFGFLSLENEEVPGNAGLKDQTLALKWVQNNIDSFGGDPDNVTIFGISAGGSSASLHLVSPLSKGLFHKAIMQSGSAVDPWAMQEAPLATAKNLAKGLGCTSDDTHEILRFLQSASATDIIDYTSKLFPIQEISKTKHFSMFAPCVEVSGSEAFLPDFPAILLKQGHFNQVPVILGVSACEGSLVAAWMGKSEEKFQYLDEHPEHFVPYFLGLKPQSAEEKNVGKEIRDYYMKGNPLCWLNASRFNALQGDILFNFGMALTRDALVENSRLPVYSYLFTNHTRCICFLLLKHLFSENEYIEDLMKEACHGADMMFMYDVGLAVEMGTETKMAIQKHIKAWATFASEGNPNCEELETTWEEDSKNKPCFIDIGTTWEMKEGIPFSERMEFWKKLMSRCHAA